MMINSMLGTTLTNYDNNNDTRLAPHISQTEHIALYEPYQFHSTCNCQEVMPQVCTEGEAGTKLQWDMQCTQGLFQNK